MRRLEITGRGSRGSGGETGGEIGDYWRGAREGLEGRLAGRLEITGGGQRGTGGETGGEIGDYWRGDWRLLAGRLEITGGGLERDRRGDWRGDWRLLEGG